MLLFAGIAALAASHTNGPPDSWLYHYQSLVSGLLALGSAIVAAILLHRQTQQAAAQERERKDGQREAARTLLSLHLSVIIRYAKGTGEGIWALMEQCRDNILPAGVQMPTLPHNPIAAAQAVKEFAEFATKEEAKYLALMFSTMQVLESRVSTIAASPTGTQYAALKDYLEDAAELYARAEALLNYARHATSTFPAGVTWDRYSAALLFMTEWHGATERISRHIAEGGRGDLHSLLPNRFERKH